MVKIETQILKVNFTKIKYFLEPTLNSINTLDFNKSFDNFVENVKLVSGSEVNWNEIDTSQFKSKQEKIFLIYFF